MLTVFMAAQSKTYRDARRKGVGVTDAIASARWSDALRSNVLATKLQAKKRSNAARKGWKTRRANGE